MNPPSSDVRAEVRGETAAAVSAESERLVDELEGISVGWLGVSEYVRAHCALLARLASLEADLRAAREALEEIEKLTPKDGRYHGGESYYAALLRAKAIAKHALADASRASGATVEGSAAPVGEGAESPKGGA